MFVTNESHVKNKLILQLMVQRYIESFGKKNFKKVCKFYRIKHKNSSQYIYIVLLYNQNY